MSTSRVHVGREPVARASPACRAARCCPGLPSSCRQAWLAPHPTPLPPGPGPVGSPERVLPAALAALLPLLLPPLALGLAVVLTTEPTDLEPSARLKVTFNSSSRVLSWECLENATYKLYIHEGTEPPSTLNRGQNCWCSLKYHLAHRGLTFEVHASVHGRLVQGALQFTNPGLKDSAARSLACHIYDGSYLNCTWARGPAAPPDTQYFLFVQNTKTHRQQECPLYMEEAGTHTSCHLRNLSNLGSTNYFLLNGTSAGTLIQFFDAIWNTKQMEWLSPPGNVTVLCNATHCRVAWRQPRTKTRLDPWHFTYQLDVQRRNAEPGARNPQVEVDGEPQNSYSFPSPEPRALHTVRIRVKDGREGPWSAWSHPVEFGSDTQDSQALRLYVPAVLGTVVCALVFGFLFKRLLRVHGLCPRIPQIKDKLSDMDGATPGVTWEDVTVGLKKAEPEEVLEVEEAP